MRKIAFRLIASGGMAAALTLGLTGAVAAASAAVAAPPASSGLASLRCHQLSCVGHDPVKYGCSVSHTTERRDGFATVWGRFSNNCDAKWARGQLTPWSVWFGDSMAVYIRLNDDSEFMCYPGPSDTGTNEPCTGRLRGPAVAYTDMVDGHRPATATVIVLNFAGVAIDQITVPI